jgi:hypothetical protein
MAQAGVSGAQVAEMPTLAAEVARTALEAAAGTAGAA